MSDDEGSDTEVKKEKGKRKTKKTKDPNAPKRPLSAFMYFCQDKRSDIQAQNPNAKFADLGKIMGAQWKELSPADKKPYEKKNQADKERYETEKANYTGPEGGDDDGGGKKKKAKKEGGGKAKKDKDKPKSAPSAYVLWCKVERPKLQATHKEATFGELGTLLGAAWKNLSDEEKEPYIKEHAELKKEADAKKKAYEDKHGKPEKKAGKKKKKTEDDDDGGDDEGSGDD